MSYDNSFLRELDNLDPKNVGSELPKQVYEYVEKRVIDEATKFCNSLMDELKLKVSKGKFDFSNGKRTVINTRSIPLMFSMNPSDIPQNIKSYFESSYTRKTLNTNSIYYSYTSDFDYFDVVCIDCVLTSDIQENFWGSKRINCYRLGCTPFTNMYIDTIKNILNKNGIKLKIIFKIMERRQGYDGETLFRKYEITDNITSISESYKSPIVMSYRRDLQIETTVIF